VGRFSPQGFFLEVEVMSKKIFIRTLVFISFLITAFGVFAQNGAKLEARPFGVGEVLVYEGKFSKIISGISVADLTFSVDAAPTGGDFLIRSEARSKGTLLKLFRFSFLQQLESTVDDQKFRVVRSVKYDQQKDRIRNSEADFDYDANRVTYVETNPKEPMRPPRKIASAIKETTQDLVSGIYAVRLLPLAVGKTFLMTISDSGMVYEVPVRVSLREKINSVIGKVWCFRIEPEIFGPKHLIEDDGQMIIWMTDDERRLPVKSQIKTSFGKIEVKLKKSTETVASNKIAAEQK
jgi:hypothetical protein